MIQTLNSEYHRLINKIETEGSLSSPRGLDVKDLEIQKLTFSPLFSIPNFKSLN
jgi:hypothetical protein